MFVAARLVSSRNKQFFYKCPECDERVPARGMLWLWFQPREWLHPDCWKARMQILNDERRVGLLTDLEDYTFGWEDAGT